MSLIKPKQNLIFDKISFTLNIPLTKREAVIDRINDPVIYSAYNRRVFGNSNSSRYKNNYQLDICNGNDLLLSLYPKNKSHNFLRAEYNPTKLAKAGMIEFRKFMIKLLKLNLVKKIYFKARVTRLDLTLDVFNMEPNIYIHRNISKCSAIIRTNKIISSQIIGSEASNCRVTMYDKGLEQGLNCKHSNHQRIEIRLRNLDCTMSQLNADLLAEFEKLNFFTGDFLKDKLFTKSFRMAAYTSGLNAALYMLDDNKRRRYHRLLERYRVHPISLDRKDLDFDTAHKQALNCLVHRKYQAELEAKAKQSINP